MLFYFLNMHLEKEETQQKRKLLYIEKEKCSTQKEEMSLALVEIQKSN